MSNEFGNNNDKLEFRQIVLGHIKRILEISSHELRNTSREVVGANFTHTIEEEDTQYSYCQAIENLGYLLVPYFDDEIQKVFDECIEIINAHEFELEDYFSEEIKEILKRLHRDKLNTVYFIRKKIEYAKKLFIELNKLMKRVDYLKSAVYGDTSNEEVVEEKEGEDENE
jgi:hypothetical protein